jgi:hypothetical protein
MTKPSPTERYYFQWQHQIYRAPHAALRKLAAGNEQGFWKGVRAMRGARYTEAGWSQSGMPKGLHVECGHYVSSVDRNVRFVDVHEIDDYDGLNELAAMWKEDEAAAVRLYEYAIEKGWISK